ncbi:MAG: MFS transporter, partial [Pseudomonadota bacterium]|nr:MFS transporter [Pseudomonadota bacterium]
MITFAAAGFAWWADGFYSACIFRAFWGVGWAGTYMPGLKAFSDIIEGPQQSRAVSSHAASGGISGAASFLVVETIGAWFGWRWGIVVGAIGADLALLLA